MIQVRVTPTPEQLTNGVRLALDCIAVITGGMTTYMFESNRLSEEILDGVALNEEQTTVLAQRLSPILAGFSFVGRDAIVKAAGALGVDRQDVMQMIEREGEGWARSGKSN